MFRDQSILTRLIWTALVIAAAEALIAETAARLDLPVIDPVRTGGGAIADRLLQGRGGA